MVDPPLAPGRPLGAGAAAVPPGLSSEACLPLYGPEHLRGSLRQRERLWWLLWSRCPGLGWVRLRAVIAAFGSLEAAWAAPAEAFAHLSGWPPGVRAGFEHFRQAWGPEPLASFAPKATQGRGVLVPGDGRWPQGIASLIRPPLGLYWTGRGSLWSPLCRRAAVAVVGTRRPSSHGLAMARRLGAALAEGGWPVVSGLAEGIDGAVHEGCLRAGGAPVGVLGTPLERVYPRHHQQLQAGVARSGLLVSEHPAGTAVSPGHFAARNRLQVALASAVVVVECPVSSGALHSANLAWSEGLPLWVVPADTGRSSAAGSNRLLARGATPLLDPLDLLISLGQGPLAKGLHGSCSSTGPAAPPLTPAQRRLLEAVGPSASLEELSARLDQPPARLAMGLMELERQGWLQAEPGLLWRPR
ncbi:MAG: DNA-processing protein DprA [Cyanobacteriota bacterium]|nr:DNA-processing protein DprA [Cyanobacteriota bacterium]